MRKAIVTDSAPKAIGPYSQAIDAGGLVFCSGQIPIDPTTMKVEVQNIEGQTRQVFANIKAVLQASGLTLKDVAKTTVFLSDMQDFAAMNAVYQEAFSDHAPARSTVEVARLPLDVRIEIECIAVRG